jgi:Na+/phosphate symporter
VKRFRWRLQRLLDVTARREQMLRWELLATAREMARVRVAIAVRQVTIRSTLARLATMTVDERLARQAAAMIGCAANEAQLTRLRSELGELEKKKAELLKKFMHERARHKTLDRLRSQALERHNREQGRLEQHQFDESAQTAKHRLLLGRG